MISLAFFNNKGGVGKTTLACNLANFLARDGSHRVLLVDLDPQCNATQLILPREICAKLYWQDSPQREVPQTVYDAVQPLEEGEAELAAVEPLPPESNRFGVSILPGHPRMSVLEDLLGRWFLDASGGGIEGVRKSNWLSALLKRFADSFDIVVFDLGPSLGSLNRSVLLGADCFMTPLGADIFSLVALRNIAEWLKGWVELYEQGIDICARRSPGALERYQIGRDVQIQRGFIGYTVQQYFTVTIRGERRATYAYEEILRRIPDEIDRWLSSFVAQPLGRDDIILGDVPNLRSLVPLAQTANAPLVALTASDGLTGGQFSQQRKYGELITSVGRRLNGNLGLINVE